MKENTLVKSHISVRSVEKAVLHTELRRQSTDAYSAKLL
jgi:hypothetical protein